MLLFPMLSPISSYPHNRSIPCILFFASSVSLPFWHYRLFFFHYGNSFLVLGCVLSFFALWVAITLLFSDVSFHHLTLAVLPYPSCLAS